MTHFVLCSSMKNLSEMRKHKKWLEEQGHKVEMPTDFDTHTFPFGLELQRVARPAHLLKIRNLKDSDVVLVINKNGHIGGGVYTEMSYAYARKELDGVRLRIICTEPVKEDCFGYEELAVFNIELFDQASFIRG